MESSRWGCWRGQGLGAGAEAENAVGAAAAVVGGGMDGAAGFGSGDPRLLTVAVAGLRLRCPVAPEGVAGCFPGDLAG